MQNERTDREGTVVLKEIASRFVRVSARFPTGFQPKERVFAHFSRDTRVFTRLINGGMVIEHGSQLIKRRRRKRESWTQCFFDRVNVCFLSPRVNQIR